MNVSNSTREMEQINGQAIPQVFITSSFFMMVSILEFLLFPITKFLPNG